METAFIPQQTANAPLSGSVALFSADRQPGSFTPLNYAISIPTAATKKTTSPVRSAADFAVTALEKALKLNLLGADINTEYLELTLRVYAQVAMITAKQYLGQFTAKTLSHKNVLSGLLNKLPGHYAFKNLAQ
ncbi:MAG: hypothetical protein NVSMB24_07550 [Mucilaginibacter sp.]